MNRVAFDMEKVPDKEFKKTLSRILLAIEENFKAVNVAAVKYVNAAGDSVALFVQTTKPLNVPEGAIWLNTSNNSTWQYINGDFTPLAGR